MLIGCCGYGGTGSTAVADYLKEFEGTQSLTRAEMQHAFKVDGLQDLEYHLVKQYARHMSGDIAIRRFKKAARYAYVPKVKMITKDKKKFFQISNTYIDSLVQATWTGFDNFDFEDGNIIKDIMILCFKKFIIPKYEKKTGKLYRYWPMRTMYLSIEPEKFYELTKKYTHDILTQAGADFSKYIILDQPFEGNDPTQSMKFFDESKAIVIDRDPRDLYVAASYQWPDGTFMPRRNVKAFVEYYRQQRIHQKDLNNKKNILFIRLERLVLEYDESSKIIKDFLGFTEDQHTSPQKYFIPQKSMKGLKLFTKVKGIEEEIKYIEDKLPEYLFPYDKYDIEDSILDTSCKWN